MTLRSRLRASLKLTIGGKDFSVPGGNIKAMAFDWTAQGFEADVTWWHVSLRDPSEDKLKEPFVENDLIEATLNLEPLYDDEAGVVAPVVLKGLVTTRELSERAFEDLSGSPIMQRRYNVRFADKLAVLWAQHRPCALYCDKTLADMFGANLPEGVELKYEWPFLNEVRPVICLGLDAGDLRASFYDFTRWLTYTEGGYLQYDAEKLEYRLGSNRIPLDKGDDLRPDETASLRVFFPVRSRATPRVLNGSTLAATKVKSIDATDSVSGVRSDFLMRSAIASDLDARASLEKDRSISPDRELHVAFSRFPRGNVRPGFTYAFGAKWSAHALQAGEAHWMRRLHADLRATNQNPVDSLDDDANTYEGSLHAELERASDTAPRMGSFEVPHWPIFVEGMVVSEIGEEDQGTYQANKDDDTSLDYYRVKVPLWDDAVVIAPYEPLFAPGQFYFPAIRDQRVLLEIHFQSARIVGFLDWRKDARLPAESQGNHLLLGKKIDDGTSVKHHYREAKPVLDIRRVANKDEQVISVSDGSILLRTQELEES